MGEDLLRSFAITALLSACLSCRPTSPAEDPRSTQEGPAATPVQRDPAVQVDLSPPWAVATQQPEALSVRYQDGPHGVRVQILPDSQGRLPGLSPILSGHTLEVADEGARWPLLSPSFRPLSKLEIVSQGPDLVVRLYGPPLNRLLTHPDAPADPALAWLRVRPRGPTWRLASQGLVILSLPAEGLREEVAGTRLESTWGTLELDTEAPLRSGKDRARWWSDSLISPEMTEPYPEVGITWTPTP